VSELHGQSRRCELTASDAAAATALNRDVIGRDADAVAERLIGLGGSICCLLPMTSWTQPHARVGAPLAAADWDAPFAFYVALFGWTKTEGFDLGLVGLYRTFATGGVSGVSIVSGVMTRTGAIPVTSCYVGVHVTTSKRCHTRRAAAGEIFMGRYQVPDGSWIARCQDQRCAVRECRPSALTRSPCCSTKKT
jgi:predicted enzyme related to lactoylglutathione lyase